MAFVSKKTTPNGDVPDYMNDLDERVKTEFLLRKDYVIEAGETLSGWFYKYDSGRLECFSKVGSWGNSLRTQVGSLYRWNAYALNNAGETTNRWFYPHPFVDTNVLVTGESTDTTFAFIKAAGTTTGATGTLYAYKPDAWEEWTSRKMVLKAEGRWK